MSALLFVWVLSSLVLAAFYVLDHDHPLNAPRTVGWWCGRVGTVLLGPVGIVVSIYLTARVAVRIGTELRRIRDAAPMRPCPRCGHAIANEAVSEKHEVS